MQSDYDNTASSTGMDNEYTNAPGGGTDSEAFNERSDQGAYNQLQSSQGENDMGGGRGAMGSGVAGGYEGSNQEETQSQTQGQTGEKQDWLDKGIESFGKKAGINIVSFVSGWRHELPDGARFVAGADWVDWVGRATRTRTPLATGSTSSSLARLVSAVRPEFGRLWTHVMALMPNFRPRHPGCRVNIV